MIIDANRAIVGLACSFDQPGVGGWRFQPHQFDDWLSLEMGVPMRINHDSVIDSKGAIMYVGRWVNFAIVEQPVRGLLALGQIDSARGYGDQMLHDLSLIFHQWLPRDYWALSIACHIAEDVDRVLPYEISLTRNPVDPDAALLGVGPQAVDRWNLLTEAAPKAA